jgi:hypothetical protein
MEARYTGNGRLSKDDTIELLFNIEREMQVYDYSSLFEDLKKIVPDFEEKEMWFNTIKE